MPPFGVTHFCKYFKLSFPSIFPKCQWVKSHPEGSLVSRDPRKRWFYDALTRAAKLEAPDGLEAWRRKVSSVLDDIVKEVAATARKALSHEASAPVTQPRTSGSGVSGGIRNQDVARERRQTPGETL